ncbi:MAG TPA: DNA-binding protein [Lachnospiraceae bacterium]|nr:DNA-binding protein [Lachnospiraceae bacterium]
MEKIIEQGILYDFYGPLLTAHQQEIYEEAVYNNLSLGEIAEEEGISRQGVHDLIKRCDKILIEYEEKLHLVERFTKSKKQLDMIKTTAHKLQKNNSEDATIILQCVDEILEEL